MRPTILENGLFKFEDTVNGDYLNRGQCAYYTITSIWNKNLKLLSLTVDDEDFSFIIKN